MQPFVIVVTSIVTILLSSLLLLWKGFTKQAYKLSLRNTSTATGIKPVISILYGTQTGTALRFAKQLKQSLVEQFGDFAKFSIKDIEQLQVDNIPNEKLLLFLVATYGDGEPTDNAMTFDQWLTDRRNEVENEEISPILQNVRYGVFGLGNKQYEHFNAFGRKVHNDMETLGAKPIVELGNGDDDENIEEDFESWQELLLNGLRDMGLQNNTATRTHSLQTQRSMVGYKVEVVNPNVLTTKPLIGGKSGRDIHNPATAHITEVRELHTPSSERSCVHVEIDVTNLGTGYKTGDHIAVFPQNAAAVVQEVAEYLGHSLDTVVSMTNPPAIDNGTVTLPDALPGPVTIRDSLAMFADVLALPGKNTFTALALYARDRTEQERLLRLASPEGKAEYHDYISRPQRCILEVLRDFRSLQGNIPLGVFFSQIVPRLQPRYYSISSSSSAHPKSVHVTCAVVEEMLSTGRRHRGVCSTWLSKQVKNVTVPVFLRSSQFKLPEIKTTPIIMVGPGTGLAPFRGFLQELATLKNQGVETGYSVLFFGCRHPDQDFIYEQELKGYEASGVLSELHVAFSRVSATKDYVQHHIAKRSSIVYDLLNKQGAYFYVCGDAKRMARDVNRELLALVQKHGNMLGHQAEAFVKKLHDEGRYQRDIW